MKKVRESILKWCPAGCGRCLELLDEFRPRQVLKGNGMRRICKRCGCIYTKEQLINFVERGKR